MRATAFEIADWFIAHNDSVMKYNSADEISNLKIQKLLYYAQGCALASTGETLFDEDIVAWKHGPVVESVYQRYHAYGRKGISDIPEYPILESDTEKLLVNIYNAFARYSAWELANLTHTEDPWKLTPLNHVIPITLIKNYFVVHYSEVNKPNDLTDNIELLREISTYPNNWDGEDAEAFDADYIQSVIDLVSTMQLQPDIGPTGRGSIDFVYGSIKDGEKYLDMEIFQNDRHVHVVSKDKTGKISIEEIGMEDVNGRVKQF